MTLSERIRRAVPLGDAGRVIAKAIETGFN
jgi:hypothetical protein